LGERAEILKQGFSPRFPGEERRSTLFGGQSDV
jgi:hypothetical protein